MSSTHDPTETASTYSSPPATDHAIDIDELDIDDGASEVSNGSDLRVRIFLFLSTATYLTTNGISRVTSKPPSKETSISRGNLPSASLSRRHPSPVYISRGSA
jgi:hypothetical protein